MAIVYLAHDADLDRRVALKELYALGATDRSIVQRFVREARVAGSLSHPNIVTVYDFFEHEAVPYIAMEYVHGGSLRPLVGALSLAQIAGVMEGVLAGLAHAERRGVVHRDLKPENLLITDEGRIEIADFGIAKAINQTTLGESLTATGMTVGTPNYMAPEQAMGRRLGPWTDLYSLGIVAYELLTGAVPFSDRDTPLAVLLRHIQEAVPDPRALRPDLDPELVAWVLALLEKPAERRPSGANAAWEALEPIVLRLAGPLWRREAGLPATAAGVKGTTAVSPAPFATPTASAYETYRTPPPPASPTPPPRPPRPTVAMPAPPARAPRRRPRVAVLAAAAAPIAPAPAGPPRPGWPRRPPPARAPGRRPRVAGPGAAPALIAAAAAAAILLRAGGGKPAPAVHPQPTTRAAATATARATPAAGATATPSATATPAATPAGPRLGRAIALRSRPSDVSVYRGSVWVATPATHSIRRVDPSTRDVTAIELDPIADPTHIEAGLGALWVDCWTDAFARVDAATGESTPIYMPTTSRTGFGFAVGDGSAWALNRQRGIVYPLSRRTGEVDGPGIDLGEPAIDAVVAGGTVYVLMKDTSLEKIDESSGEIYGRVSLPARPVGIERERSTLVIGFPGNRFATYRAGTLTHTKLFSIGEAWEYGEVFEDELWVAVPSTAAIERFDVRTGARLGDPIDFASAPMAFNFQPDGRAWVALESGELVSLDVPRA